MDAEWKKAPDFAEVAEALGINTVDVMAMLPDQVVLFTPYPNDEDPVIYSARLFRDRDGILCSGPRRRVGSLASWREQMQSLLEKMGEEGAP